MNDKVVKHFRKVDPVLFSMIAKIRLIENITKSHDFFSDLCETIINQQLSEKAGMMIFNRFKTLFFKEKITAEELLKFPDTKIRQVGTSGTKVQFLKNLAQKIVEREIKLEKLEEWKDEEVIEELTKVKGIGRWTAEMFLMFSLVREDIFSYGDLGLRRAIQKLYKLPKEPTLKQAEKISKKWSPYRTYACRILWGSIDSE